MTCQDMKELNTLRLEVAELKAYCGSQSKDIKSALDIIQYRGIHDLLKDAYEQTPKQSLAKHDQAVLKTMLETVTKIKQVTTHGSEYTTTWVVRLDAMREYMDGLNDN